MVYSRDFARESTPVFDKEPALLPLGVRRALAISIAWNRAPTHRADNIEGTLLTGGLQKWYTPSLQSVAYARLYEEHTRKQTITQLLLLRTFIHTTCFKINVVQVTLQAV